MDFIIDVQGLCDEKEEFIAKEVAVLGIDFPYFAHWVIAPPCKFNELPLNARKQNTWVTLNVHGIEWFDGDVHIKQLHRNLRNVARIARQIYARGCQKVRYLRNLLAREIHDLESESPAFNKLTSKGEYCVYHATKNTDFRCALNNAFKLKHWLKECNHTAELDDELLRVKFSLMCNDTDDEEITDEDEVIEEEEEEEEVIVKEKETTIELTVKEDNNKLNEKQSEEKEEVEKSIDSMLNTPILQKEKENEEHIMKDSEVLSTESHGKEEPVLQSSKISSSSSPEISVAGEESNKREKRDAVTNTEVTRVSETLEPTDNLLRRYEQYTTCKSAVSYQCPSCGRISCRSTPQGLDTVDSYHRQH